MLAKSLVDIAAMLKEINEGQQVTPILLKRQTDHSQQNSINSTYNKQYYTQGWKDEHQNQWSSPQQNQPGQPYNYNQPRNNQNTRYQPPHNRQQHLPKNNQQIIEDEILRILQQGNQETKEFNKQAMIQLNQVTELMQKMMSQQTHLQHRPLPAIPSPLSSQPLPNPNGGLNAINDNSESEKEAVDTDNEEAEQQLCELLIKVADSKDEDIGEILDFYEEFDNDYKEEESEEGKLAGGWGSETETQNYQGEMLSINTISDNKKDKEELPIKCEDPGPCLVTCRIK
ncbi:hypothetical protein PIB30_049795 [Stylosanthes scabra]|uniref:Uncharacterized protein n=1 Tax=Stylosanthes scabra TaxID=79078 RepID=A0ABU6QGS8_9FABA|nr:hypothetical protein [Stylosanthes scabra]